jgi:hypothetical protein
MNSIEAEWAAQLDRVRATIRKLPVLPDREHLIETHADRIRWAPELVPATARKGRPPFRQHSTKKQAVAELVELDKRATALRNHILNMRATAIEAFEEASVGYNMTVRVIRMLERVLGLPTDWNVLVRVLLLTRHNVRPSLLNDIERHASDASMVARKAIEHVQKSDVARIRRPRDMEARAVTGAAAEAYYALTGRAPTRQSSRVQVNDSASGQHDGGPFIGFLADVFEALGIDAKAAGQAKMLGGKWDTPRMEKIDQKIGE